MLSCNQILNHTAGHVALETVVNPKKVAAFVGLQSVTVCTQTAGVSVSDDRLRRLGTGSITAPNDALHDEQEDQAASKRPPRKSLGGLTKSAKRPLPVSFRQRPLQQQPGGAKQWEACWGS